MEGDPAAYTCNIVQASSRAPYFESCPPAPFINYHVLDMTAQDHEKGNYVIKEEA